MNLEEIITIAFFVNAPVQVVVSAGQWFFLIRLPDATPRAMIEALFCVIITFVTAFVLALAFWLYWPFADDWLLIKGNISLPGILGELLALPYWLYQFGYLQRKKTGQDISEENEDI